MAEKITAAEAQPIIGSVRFHYALLDAVVAYFIWEGLLSMTMVRFTGTIHTFSQADHDAYVQLTGGLMLALFSLSLAMHTLVGGSIGKWVFGCRTIDVSGEAASFWQVLLRSVILFEFALLILSAAALIFSRRSEALSFSLVLAGLACLLWPAATWQSGLEPMPSPLEPWLGLKKVKWRGRIKPND